MNKTHPHLYATAALASLLLSTAASDAALIFQLQAADYNAGTGTWVADVGPSPAQAVAANQPTLVAGQTPNGSAVLRFDGNDYLDVTEFGASAQYTAFLFVRTINNPSTGTFFSGTPGSFQFRLNANEQQNVIRRQEADVGRGTASLSTTLFSSINVTASNAGVDFRIGGLADAAVGSAATNFNVAEGITRVGASGGTLSEFFSGDIAEIRIYDTVLTLTERQNVEAEFNNSYVVPEPSALVLATLSSLGLMALRRRRA